MTLWHPKQIRLWVWLIVKRRNPAFRDWGHLDLFRNLFIRKSLQRPIYGGKVEACPFLYQSFIDFIGRQDFLSAKKKTQDLKTGLGQFSGHIDG